MLQARKSLAASVEILRVQAARHRSILVQQQLFSSHLLLTRSTCFQQRLHRLDRRDFSSELHSDKSREKNNQIFTEIDELLGETSRIISLFKENGDERTKIERRKIDSLMEQWVERARAGGRLIAAETSHELLKVLEANFDGLPESASSLVPDAASYNFVLQAYASCQGRQEAAEAASNLLDRMISRCRTSAQQSHQAPAPTTKTFNVVLNAWAKSESKEGGTKAEEVFAQLEDWLLECQGLSLPEAAPNGRTICAVMDAWAQSRALDAAGRVMAILEVAIKRQKKLCKEGSTSGRTMVIIKPDVIMFNTAIHAWVNSGKGQYGAEKAEQVLQLMTALQESGELGARDDNDEDDAGLSPNTRSFTLLINAWAETEARLKSGKGAERAEQILEDMTKRYLERGEDVMPNTLTFTACIKAWSKSTHNPQYAVRAQGVFDKMASIYRETKNDKMKPNAWSANTLISAWAKSRDSDSAERAEAALESIKEFCQPDVYTYNSVIDAYAKKKYTRKALAVFEQLESSPTLQPDIFSYNTMLGAWSKDKLNRGEAQALLDRMIADGVVKPDRVSYSCVITSCAYNKNPSQNNALVAANILQKMLQEYREGNDRVKPDVITFTSAINASANANGDVKAKRAALKFAIATLEQMKQSNDLDNPNHLTYGAMMKACSRLCGGTERIRLLEGVFQQSRDDSMVSQMVLDMFLRNMPIPVLKKYNVESRQPAVPESWCAAVFPKDKPMIR